MMIVGTMLRHCPDSGSVMGVSPRLAEPHPFPFATGGATTARAQSIEVQAMTPACWRLRPLGNILRLCLL